MACGNSLVFARSVMFVFPQHRLHERMNDVEQKEQLWEKRSRVQPRLDSRLRGNDIFKLQGDNNAAETAFPGRRAH
jgi:hypothetical protein